MGRIGFGILLGTGLALLLGTHPSRTALCQFPDFPEILVQGGSQETTEAREARLKWWREARFGLFIHWGPVSLKGTEIGWSRKGPRPGRSDPEEGIPFEIYDNLYKEFNPVNFNAAQWVQVAKDAGMKYLVFTTKHHDGFVNFDSKLTDYKITSPDSPFGRDIVAELAEACRRGGLGLGFYYSQPDWHHPDYRTENHSRYIQYLHGQLEELCTRYGKVDIIWFDGLGGTSKDWDSENLLKKIKTLQPRVIINNRAGLPADFDTPEQRIGSFQIDRPWETCMTLGTQWAWKPDDTIKSLKECIQTLVRVAGGDGNFLFNVGPMPDGRIEPRQAERLREMGEWLMKDGESVYGTSGGPFRPGSWGASTRKGNRIFVHVLQWPNETLSLPSVNKKIVKASVLTGGRLALKQTEEAISLTVDKAFQQDVDTIVVLELDGPAGEVAPLSMGSKSLAHQKKVKASSFFGNQDQYGPDKAVDDDEGTRWATDWGTRQAWLEIDLGRPCAISKAVIYEAYSGRVEKFELQRKVDEKWETFYEGGKLGERAVLNFKPVTAQHVRFNILQASEGPTIWEFHLFGPEMR